MGQYYNKNQWYTFSRSPRLAQADEIVDEIVGTYDVDLQDVRFSLFFHFSHFFQIFELQAQKEIA